VGRGVVVVGGEVVVLGDVGVAQPCAAAPPRLVRVGVRVRVRVRVWVGVRVRVRVRVRARARARARVRGAPAHRVVELRHPLEPGGTRRGLLDG